MTFGQTARRADMSWDTIVKLYAMRGTWCATARLIWRDGNYPAQLVAECTTARAAFLREGSPTARARWLAKLPPVFRALKEIPREQLLGWSDAQHADALREEQMLFDAEEAELARADEAELMRTAKASKA